MTQLPESCDTRAQAIDLRFALRTVLWTLGELGRLLVTLQEAESLAEALGDAHRLGWVAVYLLAHFAQVGDPERALAAGQRALAIAMPLGSGASRSRHNTTWAGSTRSLGPIGGRSSASKRTWRVSTARSARSTWACRGLPRCSPAATSPSRWRSAGPSPRGGRLRRKGSRWPRRPNTPIAESWPGGAWAFDPMPGRPPQAIVVLERARALVQEADLRLLVPMVAAPLGQPYALAGRPADAVPLLKQAVAQAGARQYLWDQALRMVWLGEAYLCAGGRAEAGIQAQQALAFAQAHQERGHEAYALWLLGRSRRRAILWRLRPLKRITDKRSPSPTTSACAPSRPTATAASAHCMP